MPPGSISAASPGDAGILRRFGPLALLLGVTLVLGLAGQSVARPVFVVGCAIVAIDLLREGPAAHVSGCLVLFCLAPLLRRVVDLHAGYDGSGLMISGPLLAILTPAPLLLRAMTDGRPFDPALRPFFLVGACCSYAVLLTILNGDIVQAVSAGLKWLAPMAYGAWLLLESRHTARIVEATTLTAMLIIPLLGAYGFLQYVDPPAWDRFWMTYTSIASIGQPEPFLVRVFSTMNAPAGYATFTATGLLLFGFRPANKLLLVVAAFSVLGLMLSQYRTAWISLAVGVILALFHPASRRRATILMVMVPLLVTAAVLFTPAGEMLEARLQTLGAVSEDGSGQERLAEYGHLLSEDGGTLLGHGFTTTDVMQAGAQALDGSLVIAWFSMGLVGGILYVAGTIWAGLSAATAAWRSPAIAGPAVAALLAGLLSQIPLAVISASEVGFLFWSFVGIGLGMRARPTS